LVVIGTTIVTGRPSFTALWTAARPAFPPEEQ
jgi:hypothetical protein